jgi:signal transduction histidine kinase
MNKHPENSNKEKKPKILYEPKDILLKADRIRISQVLSNLLSNAIKFTPGGTISVLSSLNSRNDKYANNNNDNGEAIVSIKDNGQGIDPDILHKLFSKFATKSFSGTGLGLYISKSIVETHGGKIWAENNPYGKGATFTFTLHLSIAH